METSPGLFGLGGGGEREHRGLGGGREQLFGFGGGGDREHRGLGGGREQLFGFN